MFFSSISRRNSDSAGGFLLTNLKGVTMEILKKITTDEDVVRLLSLALQHEWAVSFEYIIHAYSMPKNKFIYTDPILNMPVDARAQTIQIGIDEMYHALQLGIILKKMDVLPSFKTDEVIRYRLLLDNLKRDKSTEDQVTQLYQEAELRPYAFPKIENMLWNISYDEVRHSLQFAAMIKTIAESGQEDAECFKPHPERQKREDLLLLHELCRLENDLMHRHLFYVILFSEHQDLSQRLFKNSINHMRNWDKLAGLLVKMGDVIAVENAVMDQNGTEKSLLPMPQEYPVLTRLEALEQLLAHEQTLAQKYKKSLAICQDKEIQNQLQLHLGLVREHLFTQEKLLENAKRIKGLD